MAPTSGDGPSARLRGWRLWLVCVAFGILLLQLPIAGFVALWWWESRPANHRITDAGDRVAFERWFATWIPADLDRVPYLGRTMHDRRSWLPLSARELHVDAFTWVTPRHLRVEVAGPLPESGLVQQADGVTIEWRQR